jgi:hypothetical protein
MIQLEWEPDDDSKYDYQVASVISQVRDGVQMIVQFKGWSTEAKPYTGVVRLPLSITKSTSTGTCTHGDKNAPFQLVGAFLDTEFTRYEGTWSEGPDYKSTFSFDTTA